jgi:MFS family permease
MTGHVSAKIPASVTWALGLTQIIGYGTLYYSFGALAPSIARDLGWTEEWVYGVLSTSLLLGGLVAPISGAWADRFGAARVMARGSVAAALALAFCAMAPERFSFVIGLVAMEVASAFVLYATAFALLAQIAGRGAQQRITHLTLIAGFASTIFWPLTAMLHEHLTWREIYLIFAGLNLMICLPVHLWLARRARRQPADTPASAPNAPLLVDEQERRRAFAIMLLSFALLGFVTSAITVHMLPMLATLGLGSATVVITTLFGPAQVLSRLVNMQFGKDLPQPALAVLAAALMPVALIVLVSTAPWALGGAVFAILFGLGSGLSSIVSGTLPLVLFGTTGYGRRLGWISSARLVVSAFAPFIFAVLTVAISVHLTLWAVVLIGTLCCASFGALWWMSETRSTRPRARKPGIAPP